MIIPPENRNAYRELYDSGILSDMVKEYVTAVWKKIDEIPEPYQKEHSVFLLKRALLEVLHNPDDFVKVFWVKKPRARKQQENKLPGQLEMFK